MIHPLLLAYARAEQAEHAAPTDAPTGVRSPAMLTHRAYAAWAEAGFPVGVGAAPVDPDRWWPAIKDWPPFPPHDMGAHPKTGEPWSERLMGNEAVALLLAEGIVCILAPCQQHRDGAAPTLWVNCNDLFYWACADAEPLPPVGFGGDLEAPLWDLYDRVRRDGPHGADVWCCLRRGMRPQTPIERDWRAEGLWTDELEALPPRDPKECG